MLILYDVVGREAFQRLSTEPTRLLPTRCSPILLLQLPLSVINRSSLRTTILFDKVGITGKKTIDAISYFLAALLFLCIAVGSWPNMIEAWEILELEGSGVIEIPVYPIRTLVVFVGAVGFIVCILSVFQSITRVQEYQSYESEAPSAE